MVPFSWITSPWVEIKPQYKYILGLYKIEEECQKKKEKKCHVTVLQRPQQLWSGRKNYTREDLLEKPNKFN